MRRKKTKTWVVPKVFFVLFLILIIYIYGFLVYYTTFDNIFGIDMKKLVASRTTVKSIDKATRGNIYDKDGNPLAVTVTTYKLIAYLDENRTKDLKRPEHVVDKEKTAEVLSEVLGMSKEYALKQLSQDLYQTYFGTYGSNITELVKDKLVSSGLPGLGFESQTTRNYPNGDFASYIIGYAKDSVETVTIKDATANINSLVGELGIEAKYNSLLTGSHGYINYQKSKEGYKIPETKETRIDAIDGANIYLTIDSGIQRFVEAAITDLNKDYNPEWLTISVMDAKTGDILASGTTPSFDPNIKNIKNYQNPLVSYTYEPGSTMKIYSYLCAIDDGGYKGDATYLSGSYKVGDDEIFDWENKGWGSITFDKGFEYSSNVAAANIVRTNINKAKYHDCLNSYGFGQKTGIELTREETGKINFNYPIEVVAASYGQGITTTPIQNLTALTLISNHGKLLKPHIVSKIVDEKGETIYQREVEMSKQIVKEESVTKMKDLMYQVINSNDPKRTGVLYTNSNVKLIGKTGTAQYYDPIKKEYTKTGSNYIYSFAGMFPYEDPEIIIYASVKKPTWGRGSSLAKMVKSLVNNIVTYKNMNNQTVKETNNSYIVGNYINEYPNKVKNNLEELGMNVIVLGDGNKVISQYPNQGSCIVYKDKIFLKTNNVTNTIPNIKGWSRRDVEVLTNMLNIQVTYEGYGFVNNYTFKDNTLTVTLKEKYIFN